MALLSEISDVKDGRVITKDACPGSGVVGHKTTEQNAIYVRRQLEKIPSEIEQAKKDGDFNKVKNLETAQKALLNVVKSWSTTDSNPDDQIRSIKAQIERLEDSLDTVPNGSRRAQIQNQIDELEKQLKELEGKTKDCSVEDGGPGSGQKGHHGPSKKTLELVRRNIARNKLIEEHNKRLMEKRKAQNKDSLSFSPEEAKEIGEIAGVDFSKIDLHQFQMGLAVEQEHQDLTNGDPQMTAKIVLAHLNEIPDYYTRLNQMESKAGTQDDQWSEFYKGLEIRYEERGDQYYAVVNGKRTWAPSLDLLKKKIDNLISTKDGKSWVIVNKLTGQEMSNFFESKEEAETAKLKNWKEDRYVVRTKDGGVGSGKRGHVTVEQMKAMKQKGKGKLGQAFYNASQKMKELEK